jgi:hypothetical protein
MNTFCIRYVLRSSVSKQSGYYEVLLGFTDILRASTGNNILKYAPKTRFCPFRCV